MSVSIIIPNYNGEALLKKNLQKVIAALEVYKRKSKSEGEIIVVDDCSKDASVELVTKNFPKVTIVKNEKNLGFASTVNNGVAYAKGEIAILLNTDVAPHEDFIEPLLQHFLDKKVFAVGCMDESIEAEKRVLRGRGVGQWERGFLHHTRGDVDKTTTLWVAGGSGAFRRDIWDTLGGFDKLYNPFYWEDIDLSYRALKSGYKLIFEPKSVVVHEHEKGAVKSYYSSFQVKVIAYRNQFIFVWKNATDLNLQLLHLLWLPYHFAKAVIYMDIAFFAGFLMALLRFPQSQISAYTARKQFIRSDHDVIKSL